MWGATAFADISAKIQGFQSTLPVWGATKLDIDTVDALIISIHAPRVGSDSNGAGCRPWLCRFQSTLPVWGATTECAMYGKSWAISIHAPRVGSDSKDAQIFLLHLRQKGYFL